jgi:hypothetical protein
MFLVAVEQAFFCSQLAITLTGQHAWPTTTQQLTCKRRADHVTLGF